MKQNDLSNLIELLEQVVTIIQQTESVFLWTKDLTDEEIIRELTTHIQRLHANDITNIDELKILFAPTGILQDLALDSGWGKAFLVISSQADELFERL